MQCWLGIIGSFTGSNCGCIISCDWWTATQSCRDFSFPYCPEQVSRIIKIIIIIKYKSPKLMPHIVMFCIKYWWPTWLPQKNLPYYNHFCTHSMWNEYLSDVYFYYSDVLSPYFSEIYLMPEASVLADVTSMLKRHLKGPKRCNWICSYL